MNDPDVVEFGGRADGKSRHRWLTTSVVLACLVLLAYSIGVHVSRIKPLRSDPTTSGISALYATGRSNAGILADGYTYYYAVDISGPPTTLDDVGATAAPITGLAGIHVLLEPISMINGIGSSDALPNQSLSSLQTGVDFMILLSGVVKCGETPPAQQEPKIDVTYQSGTHAEKLPIIGLRFVDRSDFGFATTGHKCDGK